MRINSPSTARHLLCAIAISTFATGCAGLRAPVAAATLDLDAETRAATGATGPVRLMRTPEQADVTLEEAADELSAADVVFLGELHDSSEGHALQLALTEALAERRGEIILSMEMFERDAQPRLDLYLAGVIDEEAFLESTRAWPNYREHYRAAVEFARENGFRVLAANCYRPIASRVAKKGLIAGIGDPWAAARVDTSEGEYRRRFDEVMTGNHPISKETLDNVYAAQCVKDDTMAESIAEALASAEDGTARWRPSSGDDAPLVIHWNGRFHSDYGLGTVERLKARRPDLNIAVVSMIQTDDVGRALVGEEVDQGHFVALVPTTPE